MDEVDIARLRQEYRQTGIDEAALPVDPLLLWRAWLGDAQAAGLPEVNAMVVSTVDEDGTPSSRNVLCKDADDHGFVFFTNYGSRKATALATEPRVALLFAWTGLSRQVHVAGVAHRLAAQESDAYFATRPRGAQLGAWASRQSSVVPSRADLERRYAEVEREWQGRENRLHDRLRYHRVDAGWQVERLSP